MNEHEASGGLPAKPHLETTVDAGFGNRSPAFYAGNGHNGSGSLPHLRSAETWLFIEVLRRRWFWLVFSGLLLAGGAFAGAWVFWKPTFIASARLVRADSPRTAAVLNYQTLTPQTFVSLLRSPELLVRVAEHAQPQLPVNKLSRHLRLSSERDGDVVIAEVAGPSKQAAVDLANLYTQEAIQFTKQLQSQAGNEVAQFIKPQLEEVERQITAVKTSERPTAPTTTLAPLPRTSLYAVKLQSAREELVEALARYTELHPTVQALRAKVKELEKQVASPQTNSFLPNEVELANRLAGQRDAWEALRSDLAPLEATRRDLQQRLRAAQLVVAEPAGYYREFAPANIQEARSTKREVKIGSVTVFFGVVGVLVAGFIALIIEVLDRRLKVPLDITRVTGLPLIASAPNLAKLSTSEQSNWAFRTWMTIQGRFSPTLNHGLVCGLTSAGRGEGRSTWIKWLARAASESGYRVVTVTAQPRRPGEPAPQPPPATPENGNQHPAINVLTALPSPQEVERRLSGPEAQRVVQIPLPGWVWNLERRKQWQFALKEWQRIENVVILVELPPASLPETILLAQDLPNLLWLTDSGRSEAAETRTQLDTLRAARCRLVGAVLNRAPLEHVRKRLARWVETTPSTPSSAIPGTA